MCTGFWCGNMKERNRLEIVVYIEDNIEMGRKEIVLSSVNSNHLSQDID
jgi:HD superfamily phosphohydrolase YqeK